MPFTIQAYRRFSVECSVTYNAGLFLKLPLTYFLAFGSLITLLLLSSGPANAEWMTVFEIAQLETTISVDPDTIHRKGDLVELWVLLDSKTTQSGRGGLARSTKTQTEFDCEAGLSRVLAVTAFSGNVGSGTVVYSNSDKQKWEPVAPGSLAQVLWRFGCASISDSRN